MWHLTISSNKIRILLKNLTLEHLKLFLYLLNLPATLAHGALNSLRNHMSSLPLQLIFWPLRNFFGNFWRLEVVKGVGFVRSGVVSVRRQKGRGRKGLFRRIGFCGPIGAGEFRGYGCKVLGLREIWEWSASSWIQFWRCRLCNWC